MHKKIIIAFIVIIIIVGLIATVKIIKKQNGEDDKTKIENTTSFNTKKEKYVNYLKEKASIELYLKKDTDDKQIEEFIEEISQIEEVEEVKRFTKEDAYNELKEKFESNRELIDEIGADVFPETIIVKISDADKNEDVEEKIKKIDADKFGCIEEMSNSYYYLEKEINMVDSYSEEELDKLKEIYNIE